MQPSDVATLQEGGQHNLMGGSLKPCTPPDAAMPAGPTRTGSCAWDPDDAGFHQVCVTMTQEFLDHSAKNDGNDLSSVVKPGGNWCICAWAWASAVQRDPKDFEGLALNCDKTNGRLREVYTSHIDLQSPSGQTYESQAALAAVNKRCPHSEL